MKIQVKATVVYEWEEDTANWTEDNPQTETELMDLVQAYSKLDPNYIFDGEITSIKIEQV